MITELVIFDLPKGMTREQVVEGMRKVAPQEFSVRPGQGPGRRRLHVAER